MMKAEIASEMIRSRSQTPHPVARRASGSVFTDGLASDGGATPTDDAVASIAEADFGSGELSGIASIVYRSQRHERGLYQSPGYNSKTGENV